MRGTENLFRRFLSMGSAKVVATAIAVLSTPVIVRLLGPGGYGDYAVLLSIFSLYMIPISGTITEGVQKFVGEGRDREGWTEAVVRFYFVLGVSVVLVGASILLAVTLVGWPSRLFGPGFDRYFLLLVPFVVVSQLRALGSHTVLGFGLEHLSVRNVPMPPSMPYRELLSFNVINVGLVLLAMSLYHVDLVMLRALTDGETTGFYKAALAMAEYLWFVPIVVQRLLLHSTSDLWADGRVDAITELASRVTRQTLLLVVLLAVGLATLAPRVMGLYYGDPFVVATTPLLKLLPGTIAFAAARLLKAITQSSGQVLTLLADVGAAATVNLVLNALLTPPHGMVGAAVATAVGYTSMLPFVLLAAYRVGFNPLADLRSGRIGLTGAVAAVPIVALDHLIGPDLLALAVVPPIGLIVYVVTAIATRGAGVRRGRPRARSAPRPCQRRDRPGAGTRRAVGSGRSPAGRRFRLRPLGRMPFGAPAGIPGGPDSR